uniref:Sodium-dependent multivitamin transporter n=1 Tax=Romanomermis culicivorax TaxID=13658 RepID=A0A915J7H4_ROMCU
MQIWDYVVFSITLLASTAVGFYYAFRGDRQRTNREFLMADRNMSVFPVSMSLLASFLSAITMLGTASELYFYGTMYWMVALSYVVAIAVTSVVFIPIFYDMKLTSAYENLHCEMLIHLNLYRSSLVHDL